MGHHCVSVSQLNASSGRAFLNVDEECNGAVIVWGSCLKEPTYLMRKGIRFHLATFSDEFWAKEWLQENKKIYDELYQITPEGLIWIEE